MAATILNINLGVLGHIDSGKTSLARALSTVASTASFDKNPQSKERGITLDLGFSSFSVDIPQHLTGLGFDRLQYTLVDCPGHASLIKTIIGGAQIIDLMILVIDAGKGIQTQTAECLVIGEVTCDRLVVVLNKIDLFPAATRAKQIDKLKAKLQKTFAATRFPDPPMVAVAAHPGGSDAATAAPEGLPELIDVLQANSVKPKRDSSGPFVFAVDHCFAIKGQGTVMTGTALSGMCNVNDQVELPTLRQVKKVKSMQMFRKPVQRIIQGDRAGICVTQFDPATLERGLVSTPDTLPCMTAAVARVEKIRFHKAPCLTKARFHVSLGHATVMAAVTFFTADEPAPVDPPKGLKVTRFTATATEEFDFGAEYRFADELEPLTPRAQWVLLEFDQPVVCQPQALVIGSRLDTDYNNPAHANECRLAFHGRLVAHTTSQVPKTVFYPQLRVYKNKERDGVVDRLHDEQTIIGRALFKKETQMEKFTGLKVELSTGEVGVIEGGFGQSGKFKVTFRNGLKPETVAALKSKGGKGSKGGKAANKAAAAAAEATDPATASSGPITVHLRFKRYVFDADKTMVQ